MTLLQQSSPEAAGFSPDSKPSCGNALLLSRQEITTLVTHAEREKERLSRPDGSQFRVVCLVRYRHSAESSTPDPLGDGDYSLMVGANMETTSLCGGVCAEKSAFTQLRVRDEKAVVTQIMILTDAFDFIAPGAGCREFLSQHFGILERRVPIYLVAHQKAEDLPSSPLQLPQRTSNGNNTASSTEENAQVPQPAKEFKHSVVYLENLWPYPCPFIGVKRDDIEPFGREMQLLCEAVEDGDEGVSDGLFEAAGKRLYREIMQRHAAAAEKLRCEKQNSRFHPLFFIAGVVRVRSGSRGNARTSEEMTVNGDDGTRSTASAVRTASCSEEMLFARQTQSIEYPCSVDAVSKLTSLMEANEDAFGVCEDHENEKDENENRSGRGSSLLLLNVDQFGLCQAPFAPARAYFAENGLGDCRVWIHEATKLRKNLRMDDLYDGKACVIEF
mmetsp:Transcript_14122/g.35010  ORF Transcript_14122/g.35010 Transcript_14122/m.35010 type:complete len:444 (+) Transcript_14122:81-1412(+)|eukprot:g10241.t1